MSVRNIFGTQFDPTPLMTINVAGFPFFEKSGYCYIHKIIPQIKHPENCITIPTCNDFNLKTSGLCRCKHVETNVSVLCVPV